MSDVVDRLERTSKSSVMLGLRLRCDCIYTRVSL